MRPFARALLLSLTAALLAAAPGVAQPRALSVLQGLASLSAAELVQRLRDGHAAVNEALSVRKQRLERWKTAKQARDASAAMVASLKAGGATGPGLENALRAALALDEEAARTRSQLAESEALLAARGAELLGLYDGAMRIQRKEILELNKSDPRRAKAVNAYRALAARRDEVRAALRPALQHEVRGPTSADLDVSAGDDVGSLLEKADLARDLEERFLRRARAIQKRIQELEEQADLAQSVSDLARDQSLFDEDSRRLVVSGSLGQGPQGRAAPGATAGRDSPLALGDAEVDQGGNSPPAPVVVPPPPPSEPSADPAGPTTPDLNEADDGAGFEGAPTPNVGGERVNGGGVDVSGQPPAPGLGEQIFLGATDADVDALLASGRLDLRQLKALERRLRSEADAARKKGANLRDEVRSRSRR